MKYAGLERSLGHGFLDRQLLITALTHRSHSSPHNERLEYLGDSLLNCAVALMLYRHFPELPEGDLSRLRANLVRQDTLHQLALQLGLGSHLRLGEGELRSGGHQRPSILADGFEALLGAVHLDAGFDALCRVVDRFFSPLLAKIQPGVSHKDPKTRLQEYLQARRMALPRYQLQATEGEAHAQQFSIACQIPELKLTTEGQGSSRRAAEQMAAAQALAQLTSL